MLTLYLYKECCITFGSYYRFSIFATTVGPTCSSNFHPYVVTFGIKNSINMLYLWIEAMWHWDDALPILHFFANLCCPRTIRHNIGAPSDLRRCPWKQEKILSLCSLVNLQFNFASQTKLDVNIQSHKWLCKNTYIQWSRWWCRKKTHMTKVPPKEIMLHS